MRRVPDNRDVGDDLHELIARLYPICRSITGAGVRETLAGIAEFVPLVVHEVPSGTRVLDWTVPPEWAIRGAYIDDPTGRRIVDFADHNLHVVGYSTPVHSTMPLSELRAHLHSLPDQPALIPYRTSFYAENWGFCLADEVLQSLPDGDYRVVIDSSLEPGSLSYGEVVVPGASGREVLISAHVCHPSLCNDNLSGIAIAAFLAAELCGRAQLRYTYRFVFAPATIGAITWLARNADVVERIDHGLVLALLGDAGAFTYKRSRKGAAIDRAAAVALADSGRPFRIEEFTPYGYDERQYCSPGFDLPVGTLMRTPFAQFPEYHTSADDLNFVRPEELAASLHMCRRIVDVLEGEARYLNLSPKGEPQLGRRGIYRGLAERTADGLDMAMLWLLNQSDGNHTLVDIAERSREPFEKLRAAADVLLSHGLLERIPDVS